MEPPVEQTFAAAFGAALDRRRVSLTWLRDRLAARGYRVSLATLSYWRAGHREPARLESMETLSEIEALLDVPEGALASRTSDRRRRNARPAPFDTLVLGVAEGDLTGEPDVVRVLFHMTVDVDRGERRITSSVTQMFVAARDGVTGVSMFVGPDVDRLGNSSQVEAVSGCRIGSIEDRPDGIRTAWLEFERPCRAGESVLTVTRVVDSGPQVLEETEYGMVAEQRLEECLLLVRFAADDVPTRCWAGYQEGAIEDEWEVELAGTTTVHQRQTAFGPGVCRVRWEW